MKRTFRCGIFFILVLVALIFSACSSSSSDSGSYDPSGTVVGATLISKYSLKNLMETNPSLKEELLQNFKQEMISELKKGRLNLKDIKTESDINNIFENNTQFKTSIACEVAAYKVDYQTTDPFGEVVTASMRVLVNYTDYWWWGWKKWYACSDRVVLHCHATQLQDSAIPSKQSGLHLDENGLFYETCFHDNMVVSPDYLGYGSSKDRIHPYLIQDNTGKQCWDAACAAISWKRNNTDPDGNSLRGVEDDFYTVSFGYSQGGAAALATQKYIEENETGNKTHFRGAVCGDGPYDLMSTFEFYKGTQGIVLPSVLTLILRSYLYYYKDSYLKGFTAADYLKSEVIEALKDGTDKEWSMIDSKDKSSTDIDHAIKKAVAGSESVEMVTVDQMFNPDALNPDSAAYKALKKAFDANNLTATANWKNGKNNNKTIAVHFYADEVVPYVNFQNLYNNLTIEEDYYPSTITFDVIKGILEMLGLDIGVIDDFERLMTYQTPNPQHDNPPTVYYADAHVDGGKMFFVGDLVWNKKYKIGE